MRDDIAAMPNLTLEQFEDAYLVFVEAFNRGDFATAFAGLAPDCEFRTLEDLPGERVIVGREQVIAFFEEVLEVLPDWHVESVRVLKAADVGSSPSIVGWAVVAAVERQPSGRLPLCTNSVT